MTTAGNGFLSSAERAAFRMTSLYLRDPDGNEVELYVDDPHSDWQHSDAWMDAPVKPLQL